MGVIAIDFDGVIHDRKGRGFGKPLPGALEAVEAILDAGYEVIIHSCVAKTERGKDAIINWLENNDFEFNDVTATKPLADLYIDDKGLHHTDWPSTIKQINERLHCEIQY